MGNFSESIYFLQVFDLFDVGGKSAMDAKDFIIDHCGDSEVIKHFCERSPYVQRTIFSNALVVEAINLGDQPWLMVSPQKSDSVFIPDFEGQQHEECLNAVSASINVVSQEDVIGIGRVAPDLEELK